MKTTTVTINDIIKEDAYCPFPVEVIPNYMGINLCSVESITYTKQPDNQLVSLTVNFIPEKKEDKQ